MPGTAWSFKPTLKIVVPVSPRTRCCWMKFRAVKPEIIPLFGLLDWLISAPSAGPWPNRAMFEEW